MAITQYVNFVDIRQHSAQTLHLTYHYGATTATIATTATTAITATTATRPDRAGRNYTESPDPATHVCYQLCIRCVYEVLPPSTAIASA